MLPLSSNFQVTRAHNIFRQNIHLEKFQKICRVAWNIFSAIVFPIGLVRLGIKFLARRLILPASHIFDINGLRKRYQGIKAKNSPKAIQLNNEIQHLEGLISDKKQFISNNVHQVKVTTADGVELDTRMVLNDKQRNLDPANQKWILYANSNATCMEQLLQLHHAISDATGANVYTGNYRGVMESKGSFNSTHDLVLDVEAMVQKLLSTGIQEENIMIHGWSLGGGAGTEVAFYHQTGEMKICNDRSFSTLTDVIVGFIGKIGKVVGAIVSLAGFRFNTIEKLEKINPRNRIIIVGKTDGVIPHPTSPYKMLKKKNLLGNSFKLKGNNLHGYPFYTEPKLLQTYAEMVKRVLNIA